MAEKFFVRMGACFYELLAVLILVTRTHRQGKALVEMITSITPHYIYCYKLTQERAEGCL
jgi:hypothetical protein